MDRVQPAVPGGSGEGSHSGPGYIHIHTQAHTYYDFHFEISPVEPQLFFMEQLFNHVCVISSFLKLMATWHSHKRVQVLNCLPSVKA